MGQDGEGKMDAWDIEATGRTDQQWREILNTWSNDDLLRAYRALLLHEATPQGRGNVQHALWCMAGYILERMGGA